MSEIVAILSTVVCNKLYKVSIYSHIGSRPRGMAPKQGAAKRTAGVPALAADVVARPGLGTVIGARVEKAIEAEHATGVVVVHGAAGGAG